jgi:hypothetical protein
MTVILICSQWAFGFAGNKPAQLVPVVIGILIFVMALLTDFGLGIVKIIPMKIHLLIDVFVGVFLALSPWLFGFHKQVYLPHLIFGIIEIGGAIMTNPKKKDNPGIT